MAGLLLAAPGAGALDLVICGKAPLGLPEEAANCNAPVGVAADREAGLLFVADDGNEEVDVFEADGTYVHSFDVGPAVSAIAVDNDPASTAQGRVYLFDTACNCVRRFLSSGAELLPAIGAGQFATQSRVALGPGGLVHVADRTGSGSSSGRRVQKFDHEGTETFECASTEPGRLPGKLPSGGGHGENLNGFAVDSTGALYFSNSNGAGVRKYDSSCALLGDVHAFGGNASFSNVNLAVDAEDNLFVRDSSGGGGFIRIYAYTPIRELFRVLYGKGTLLEFASSISPLGDGTDDDLVAVEGLEARRVVRFGFEPPGPVVNPDPQFTLAPQALIRNTSAMLETRINPEGKATDFRFQYVDDETYQESGFDAANESATEEVMPGGSLSFIPPLFRDSPGQIEVGCPDPEDPPQPECLKPETLYHFRAVAKNADGESFGPEKEFETLSSFVIFDTWSSRVGIDAGRLHARVNPLGIPTEGRFEYVEETICLADEVAAEGESKEPEEVADACFARGEQTPAVDFGGGEAFQAAAAQLSELSAGTAYRYRVAVQNAFGQADVGETLRFETFARPAAHAPCPNDELREGAAARLPDCRAWEMVSPVDKEGGEILIQDPIKAVGSEFDELFRSAASVPANGPGLTYSSHRAFGDIAGAPLISQYLARRGLDGWSSEGISPPREGSVFSNLSFLQNQYRTFSEDLTTAWLRTEADPPLDEGAIAGFSGLYRRENANERYEALCPAEPPSVKTNTYTPSLAAVSADGGLAAIEANDALTPDAATTSRLQVYACGDRDGDGETSDEQPVLVSVLPGGEANTGFSGVGTFETPNTHRNSSTHNAISVDGSRVYWSDRGEASAGPGRLYLREAPLGEGPECTGPGTPCTREVSEAVGTPGDDATAIFWTASSDGSTAIFSFDAGPLAGNLYRFDATEEADPTELLAEGVSGLAGWSEDADRLYAVSSKDLDEGGAAEEGEPNLYLLEPGSDPTLVAPLSSGTQLGSVCLVDTHKSLHRCARTTPDGSHLLFLSADPLTGYDSTDVTSPAPCGEIDGICDAQVFLYDAAEEELRCVSCNPTGARPRGRALPEGAVNVSWFAARIPGNWDSEHGARALSEDGRRLFFESFDALSPTDTNGALDVYQWEEAGMGSCTEARPEFSPQAGGCIELISSGKSPRHSWLADASADGSDVFFRTAESLWPADPGLIDLYDARVGGGYLPPSPPEEPCEGDACASPPNSPQAPTPASEVFVGPEGLPPGARPCQTRAKKGKQAKRGKATSKRARRFAAKDKRCRKPRRAKPGKGGGR